MSRLGASAAILLLAAARSAAAPPAVSTPAQITAAAREQVRAGCKAAPKSCAELTAIEAGYRAQLAKVEPCEADPKKCTPELVLSTLHAAEALDLREEALPAEARAAGSGRPLLRLSLLLSKQAVFAYSAVVPDAIGAFMDASAFAPKDVEAACALVPMSDTCLDARQSLTDAQLVVAFADICEKKPPSAPCDFESLEIGGENAEAAMKFYERASAGTNVMMATLFALIKAGEDRLSLLVVKDLKRKGDALEFGLADLSSRLDRGDAVLAASRFNALSDTYRKASVEADRVSSFGYANAADADAFRERVNASATRLAAVRAKLAAASADGVAKGLAPGAGDAGGAPEAIPADATKGSPRAAHAPPPSAIFDRRLIPAPPPEGATAPPIIPGERGALELAKNLYSDDALKAADAHRRAGLSYTVGDPAGRASLVHTQSFGNTCAVVAQQQVLAALRLVPNDDPVKTEEALAAEAVKRGFFKDGTPTAYSADLLVDRNVLVTKRTGAPLAELDAAVRRGGMVIAAVDARYLWNSVVPDRIGHSIVITGAQVDRRGGRTTGFYINDSGTNPPGRGRFIPIETFRKAWDGFTKNYAEVR